MKVIITIAALCLAFSLASTNALAEPSPAMLGAFKSTHVQPLTTENEVRGTAFFYKKNDLGSILNALYKTGVYCRSAATFMRGSCTGVRINKKLRHLGFYHVQTKNRLTGKLEWKKY